MSPFFLLYSLSLLLVRFSLAFPLFMGIIFCSSAQRQFSIPPVSSIKDRAFYRTISGISNRPLLDGNRVKILNTGKETFQVLYKLLKTARKSINIETYIMEDDSVGRSIADILIKRARQGVRINMIIDSVGGSNLGEELVQSLKEAGVQFYFFNRFDITSIRDYNYRTHRKLIIIDGKVGLTGGFGLSEFWDESGEVEKARDVQILLKGPVVSQMQSSFMQSWFELSGQLLTGDDYFPELLPQGDVKARLLDSRPYLESSAIQQLYIFALNTSQEYFWLENGYFVPDPNSLQALQAAAQRGVDVRLILPHVDKTDISSAAYAGQYYYDPLLEAGVKIYQFLQQNMHAKFAIADDLWVTIGSANFDNRSFKINREANVDIHDQNVALEMKRIFLNDLKKGRLLEKASFKQRSFFQKIPESFYHLFEEYL